ncbi:MAG: ABC transporter permease [Bifidobacteriaceae bacterium]|jgi:multidrug/hemolysin transport system permease protein|nr:ABC transporter permease [Bifidobacteriaceae bacterium]
MTALALARRNLTVYLRDRVSLFFSKLAPLILVILYVGFFGAMYKDSLTQGDYALPPGSADAFVDWWLIAALVAVTAMTTPIMGLAHMAEDKASGRLADFQVAPLRGRALMAGYVLSIFVFACAMSIGIGVVGLVYAALQGHDLPSLPRLASALAATAVSALVFAAFAAMVGSFVSSNGAASAVSTILGTFSGFLAGAYVPVGLLGSGTTSVIASLPFGQSATLVRDLLAGEALDSMTSGAPASVNTDLRSYFGFTAEVGGWAVPAWLLWVALAAFGAIFAAVCAARARRLRR